MFVVKFHPIRKTHCGDLKSIRKLLRDLKPTKGEELKKPTPVESHVCSKKTAIHITTTPSGSNIIGG